MKKTVSLLAAALVAGAAARRINSGASKETDMVMEAPLPRNLLGCNENVFSHVVNPHLVAISRFF